MVEIALVKLLELLLEPVLLLVVFAAAAKSDASCFRSAFEAEALPEAKLFSRFTRSCVTALSLPVLLDVSLTDSSSADEVAEAATVEDMELVEVDVPVVPVSFSSSSMICSRAEEATAETFIREHPSNGHSSEQAHRYDHHTSFAWKGHFHDRCYVDCHFAQNAFPGSRSWTCNTVEKHERR